MKTQHFRHLVESGVRKDTSPSTRRVIILSNYIALTLATASLLLFFIIPGHRNTSDLLQMLSGVIIFSFPILLNHWQFTVTSRIYECWLPPILIFWLMSLGMKQAESVSTASYDGLRFYLLATSSIPYLLLERKNALLLLVCVFPGLIAILFCDPILDLLGVGMEQKGIPDSAYEFTPVRSFIAYLVINGCGLSLKTIVNASDLLNEKLVSELTEKNKMLRIQSEEKLKEREALFSSLVNSSEDAIISNTMDGMITSWNTGATKLFGYNAEEAINKHISMLIPQSRLQEEEEIMQMINRLESVEHFETERLKKNGDTVHVSLTVSPVIDGHGNNIGTSRIARDITERIQVEEEKDKARYQLNERVKELNTLYHSSQILQAERMTIEDVLQEMVSIIPAGWQYPEITAARIIVGPQEFVTSNYDNARQKQLAEISTPDGLPGSIEVIYLKDMPESAEGPFLMEERNLINMLAEMLRIYLTRKQEADSLKKSEASLNAIINNTTFFIWSVNIKYELQNCNKPFRQFIKEQFGTSIKDGQSIVKLHKQGVLMEVFAPRWIEFYTRALAGESFDLVEEHVGRNFKFSLNPIIENEMVTGVSVFSEETTELKRKERELLDAQKQIGDLKLMALRAAMNPHFIFNTLNSIQYYIMENDQRNAVNYLSTFSKLIRGILNNSVQTKVKLSDELDMLKHYVTLEQMRFENKFDFHLDVEENLDLDDIEIPSMLIQPYVENAILHGINNKPGRGNLKISVRNAKKCVLFEVEDDGIGREATKKMRLENLNQHKSFGTALTEERLKLINSQRNVSCEIIDLEKDGKPAGTKVKIWVNE